MRPHPNRWNCRRRKIAKFSPIRVGKKPKNLSLLRCFFHPKRNWVFNSMREVGWRANFSVLLSLPSSGRNFLTGGTFGVGSERGPWCSQLCDGKLDRWTTTGEPKQLEHGVYHRLLRHPAFPFALIFLIRSCHLLINNKEMTLAKTQAPHPRVPVSTKLARTTPLPPKLVPFCFRFALTNMKVHKWTCSRKTL